MSTTGGFFDALAVWSRGPQQHDAPLQRTPHLQWCACSAASNIGPDANELACALRPDNPSAIKITGKSQRSLRWEQNRKSRGSTQEAFETVAGDC
jgi:hypothetical protein